MRRPAILDDYVVYLEEENIGIKEVLMTLKEVMNNVNSGKWLDAENS